MCVNPNYYHYIYKQKRDNRSKYYIYLGIKESNVKFFFQKYSSMLIIYYLWGERFRIGVHLVNGETVKSYIFDYIRQPKFIN